MCRIRAAGIFLFGAALLGTCDRAQADEGGIGFWLPGQYGSLAAVPGSPGLSATALYYHASADAGRGEAIPRGGRLDIGVRGDVDLAIFGPTWGFEEKLFGAHAGVGLLAGYGQSVASVSGQLTGPNGNTISAQRTDTLTGFADLFPLMSLAWNDGVHNYMTYITGDIPVGAYDKNRLANLGLGHGVIDTGGAYTYLNPTTGLEFSATSGFTFNFVNTHTDYQNGVDWHLDVALSQFLSKDLHIGLVGYVYQQISGDSGSGAVLGSFESRVMGLGPEIGYFIPAGSAKIYLNLKGYSEFAAEHRPSDWNLWLTLAIVPAT